MIRGRFDRASNNGEWMLPSSWLTFWRGVTERMPTMITGTMRLPLSAFASGDGGPVWDPDVPDASARLLLVLLLLLPPLLLLLLLLPLPLLLPLLLLLLLFWLLLLLLPPPPPPSSSSEVLPKRKMRKKLMGEKVASVGLLVPSSPELLPPLRSALARLPFWRARRKLSKLPSTPSLATSWASAKARSVLPTNEAAIAVAATERCRDSLAAWSSVVGGALPTPFWPPLVARRDCRSAAPRRGPRSRGSASRPKGGTASIPGCGNGDRDARVRSKPTLAVGIRGNRWPDPETVSRDDGATGTCTCESS